ncbi:MAG: protein-glutamine gamma-glutamyltransferase [Candidatus Sumerlaeota bacterium]|nr:protein-glutamine gamma-glutamyltransferase [Candidatus Sumerlaeota bacterium]
MSFLRSFHLLTYATALWAFLALVSTGQLHLPAVAFFLLAYIVAISCHRRGIRLPGLMWTFVSLGAFALALYGWQIVGERLYSVTYFFLYLEINKLFTAEKNRDYLQVYALTFFQVLAASVSTESVLFAPMLAVYVFLVIASLMTFTIKRDAEIAFAATRRKDRSTDPSAPRPAAATRAVAERIAAAPYLDSRLTAWLSILTFLVLLIGSVVFWIVPRTSSPNFFTGLSGRQGNTAKSAFSDNIDFSGMEQIQNDPTIVMRATPEADDFQTRPEFLRIRGTALDLFTGREWSKSPLVAGRISSRRESSVILTDQGVQGTPFTARITLEPESSGYLFSIDQPYNIDLPEFHHLDIDVESGSARSLVSRSAPISYTSTGMLSETAQSAGSNPLRNSLAAPGGARRAPAIIEETGRRLAEIAESIRLISGLSSRGKRAIVSDPNYLQTPRTADMRVITETAAAWTEGLTDDNARAHRIEERLRTEFDYSLDISFSNREDHLAYFLTEARRGHCEYFATTMALMLRSQGIPSRVVNGYLTDEWSPSSRRYIVRQEHAHSWVEAQIDHTGRWFTFDPTPASGIGSNRISHSFYHTFSQWTDALKVFWYESYIDFNLTDQREGIIAFLRTLRAGREKARTGMTSLGSLWTGDSVLPINGRQLLGGMLLFIGLGLAAFLSVHVRRFLPLASRDGRSPRDGYLTPARVRVYIGLLRQAERLRPRPPSQTPLEYARTLADQSGEQLRPFHELTQAYYAVRYDQAPWTPELDELAAQARQRFAELSPETS